ncbi:winged helix-turn-helix domain-containing protein [Bradyrhizobium sp. CNPSo 4010]|uniref:Winged helix-turn-helix domain-containing protein n=1 Tax=Bradyrhizobium agreste TaxID=2751811 RepID=A0ABS0PJ15_9BRAD|nr:winged helix-turn-helix domain-containing protein [Bradyrhizobium agreste]MBH5397194.1 winged helix-turn-helix domain-containing protein [Bradyrhizobium agreste]
MSDRDERPGRTFLFGPFRLSTSKRVLLEGDRVVRLGGKAIEILIALLERAGELVSKRELVEIAWPDTFVVEANLTVQVAALRRALGEDDSANQYIVNSPGRGYRFVAPIRVIEKERPPLDQPASPEAHNLPAQLIRLVGRSEALRSMKQKLTDGRLLSIVGPPGVGKTSTALRLAETMLSQFRDGVWLIDLGSIADASLIASVIASALPIDVRSSDMLSGIAAALRYKSLLLVFDNCEHLIDGAAAAIGELLRSSGDIKALITSREPLRIEGEHVFRLPPLEVPPMATSLSPKDLMAYPAVQLFVERAAAIINDFELTDANAAFAAQICRELDGNPLAIEVAAARVDAFGVKGLAARIEDRMHLLADARRGTPARHRTIAAALEWSYQLLSERERHVLRCLGIFAGNFTLEAAVAVIPTTEGTDTASIIADLVCKSLVSVDIGSEGARFRLLEITKAFALAKLIEESERNELAVRLASCLTEMLRKYADGPKRVQTLRDAVQELDNVRGMLNWAFSPGGQPQAGIALTAAAVPVWLENSLLTECIVWTTKAIEALEAPAESEPSEMILKAAFGLAMMFTEGMTSQSREALNRSIELAGQLGDPQWELRARLGLVLFLHRRGDFKGALEGTKKIERLVADVGEPAALAMTKSVKSASLFFRAEYATALNLAREAHEYFRIHSDASHIGRWGLNHSIYAQCVMARSHWNLGRFDRTVLACLSAHSEAEKTGNPTSICQALSWCGVSLFLSLEDLDRAAGALQRFRQVAQDNNIKSYVFASIGYEGRLFFLRGEIEPAERLLREALSKLSGAQYDNVSIPFLGRLAELLAVDGRPEEGLLASAECLERTKATDALWLLPDALRIHGDVLAVLEGPDSRSAEAHLRESIEVSERQAALGWELRSAESLANFLRRKHQNEEASAVLGRTLGKFSEGLESIPFRRAKALLDELRRVASAEEARPSARKADPRV